MTAERPEADTNSGPDARTDETAATTATTATAEATPAEAAPASDEDEGDEEGGEKPAAEAAPPQPTEAEEEERAAREEAAREEAQATPEERAARARETRFLGAIGFARAIEGLKSMCLSVLGRQTLGRMRLLRDAEAVKTCLEQTREFLRVVNDGKRLALADCHDVKPVLGRASKDKVMEARDLKKVWGTLLAARETKRNLETLDEAKFPKLRALATHLDPVEPLLAALENAIDPRGDWRPGASERLGEIHKRARGIKDEVEKVLAELCAKPDVALALHNPRPVVRDDRLVLALKAQKKDAVAGAQRGKGRGAGIVFVEPEAVKEHYAQLTQLEAEEKAEGQRLRSELTQLALAHQAIIERTAGTLGWLDFTQAKALLARDKGLSVPQVADDGVLELHDAFHPMLREARQQKKGERQGRGRGGEDEREELGEAVPFSLALGQSHDILVLSGPKQGGKTVTVRAVGLCVAMAQCGLPIPAGEKSRVPVFKHLFADIGEGRTGPAGRSPYHTHLQRVREIAAEATKDTLVLIDDLGGGTDPDEGAALGQALLEKLAETGARALITTHQASIKSWAAGNARAANAAMVFDREKDKPTFKLIVGHPGTSASLSAARRAEVPADLLRRAEELVEGKDGQRVDKLVQTLQAMEAKAHEEAQRAEQLRRAALTEKQVLEEERHSIEKKKTALAMEADLEMDERFLSIQRAIREAQASGAPDALAKLGEKVDELLKHTPFEQKRREFASKLKKGQPVFVVSLGQIGDVVSIQRDKGKLKVACGALVIDTTFDNVSWIAGRYAAEAKPVTLQRAGSDEEVPADGKNDEYGFRKGQRPTNFVGFESRGGGRGGPGGGRGGPGGGGRGPGGPGGGRGGPGGGRGPGGPGGGGGGRFGGGRGGQGGGAGGGGGRFGGGGQRGG